MESLMCQIQDLDRVIEITVEYVHSFLENLNNFVFKTIVLNDLCEDVVGRLPKSMKYIEFINYMADYCASKVSYHPEYNKLASYICVKKLHLQTYDDVTQIAEILYYNKDVHNNHAPIISKQLYDIYMKHKDIINKTIDFNRDYDIDYFGIKTLERSYLMRINKNISNSTKFIIERPQHLFMRVSFGIHGENLEKAFETYHYMSQKYFIHATPTLFNAGTPFPQNSSCFLLGCEDSMEGIMESQKEMALISKFTGGVGVHFSSIRGKNSLIRSANGLSDGILPLCVYTCKLSRYVNQGGKRGGAIAVYLEVHHPDIFEFCELRIPNTGNDDNRARDLFLALWVCDLFMKRVENDEMWSLMCPDECPNLNKTYGDEFEKLYIKYEQEKRYKKQVKARDLFEHILNCQMSSGLPYIAFKDNVNRKSNQQNLGTIRSSNLCVHGDTMIFTDKGYKNISSIVNTEVNVWNGKEWSNVTVRKTNSNVDLIRVNFSNGVFLDCTPQHKFYIQTDYYSSIKEVEAKDLKNNDNIIKLKLPEAIEFGNDDFKYPYTHGFFCGDGTTCDNYSKTKKVPLLSLYGEKTNLLPFLDHTSHGKLLKQNNTTRITLTLHKDLENKYVVPMNHSIDIRLRWFEGLCDSDGTISKNGTNEALQISSIHKDFLINVRYMLHTLGVESKIKLCFNAGKRLLPDGKGGNKLYDCQKLWRLLVSSSGLFTLSSLGFSPKRLKYTIRKPNRNAEQFIKVTGIEKSYESVDTFCFTEPKRHMGVFNGILTGQCIEIMEYSDENETAVCNLASICLPRFIENGKYNFEKLQEITRICIRNLNKVIDINYYPTEKAKRSNMRHRPVGLGIQGLSDLYNILELPFESDEAVLLNKKIFETIYFAAIDESCKLAQKYGPYETFQGSPFSKGQLQFHLWGMTVDDLVTKNEYDWHGLIKDVVQFGTLNSLTTALMPTASTSQIMKCSECMEPIMSNMFTRSTLAGEFTVINENLINALEKINLWNEDMRHKILDNKGSIQKIDEIPQKIREIYKTAFELKLKSIVSQAADRGPFIDQSQSMNLFMEEQDRTKLRSALFYGWKRGLKTGMYYLRTTPAADALKFGLDIKQNENTPKIKPKEEEEEVFVCRMEKGCVVCGS
jgi:ribonucleoside-diphosphate reductase alpha chain